MLLLSDLIDFVNQTKQNFEEIGDTKTLVSDEDFAKYTKDFSQTKVGFVAVIPSANPNENNEDNIQYDSIVDFYFIKPHRDDDGINHYLKTLIEIQNLVVKFVRYLNDIQTRQEKCPKGFEYVSLKQSMVDPVSNFHSKLGYTISITITNPL